MMAMMQIWREELVLWLSALGFDSWRLVVLAVLVVVLIAALLNLLKNALLLILKSLNQTPYYDYFDFWYSFFKRIRQPAIWALSSVAGFLCLPLTPSMGRIVDTILLLLLTFFAISLIQATIFDFATYMTKYLPSRGKKEIDKTAITFFKIVVSIVLWLVALVAVLRAWNYDVTVLLSGLGVGAIIISFSAQNFLKDIFAFFTIYTDKSFAVGDYIVTGPHEGTVREIRLRTTRITAPSGQDLIIANNVLIGQTLSNFSNLPARRVSLDLFFQTSTQSAAIEAVIKDIKTLFKEDDKLVRLGYVNFREMFELSFVITLVYFYHSSDYTDYLVQREQLNLAIVRIFHKHGVKFSGRHKVLKGDELL